MALELPGAPEQRVRASGSVDVGACGCLCWAEGSASSRQKGKRRNEVPPPSPRCFQVSCLGAAESSQPAPAGTQACGCCLQGPPCRSVGEGMCQRPGSCV